MPTQEVVPGIWQFSGYPRSYINCYLVGDTLIDAGIRWGQGRLLSQLRGRSVREVVLTHCHPDHQGAAALICERFGATLACHEADVPAAEGRAPIGPDNRIVRLGVRCWAGPPYPVARVLHEGDELAGFRVIHAPGHTAGHIILFRDADRVTIAGDLVANINFFTGRPGLRQPPSFFSVDPALNRRSIKRLAELRPSLACFGHGPPLRDPALLDDYVARLGQIYGASFLRSD
jgi:hydroxyacylglutathione hydrolase